jgi:RimJ/RimL family protein N-acetyltransferase
VLDFAFHVLQLRNVLLETLEWNVAGLTAYERAGFVASAFATAR